MQLYHWVHLMKQSFLKILLKIFRKYIPVNTKLPTHEKNPLKNALKGNVPTIAQ